MNVKAVKQAKGTVSDSATWVKWAKREEQA